MGALHAAARAASSPILHPSAWSPPGSGVVKLNFDAGFISDINARWGFVMRDHGGNIILTGSKLSQGFGGATVEEAWACLHGLRNAHAHGCRNIIIESDYLQLIQMVKSKSIYDNLVGLFVEDIFSFVANFDFFSWSFVKREGNQVAHALAHGHPLCLDGQLWNSNFPEDVSSKASNDMYHYLANTLI